MGAVGVPDGDPPPVVVDVQRLAFDEPVGGLPGADLHLEDPPLVDDAEPQPGQPGWQSRGEQQPAVFDDGDGRRVTDAW